MLLSFSTVSSSWSTSLTSATGAVPQAPRHSSSTSVKRPSNVVSPSSIPSLSWQYAVNSFECADLARKRSADLDEKLALGLQPVFLVKRGGIQHLGRRQAEKLGGFLQRLHRDPVVFMLDRMQHRQQCRALGRKAMEVFRLQARFNSSVK